MVGCVVCLSVVKVSGRFGVEGPKKQIAGRKVDFWKKAKGIVSKSFFQTPPFFFDTDCSNFKTHYKECIRI
jgi:hypothetical protein